MRCPFLFLGFLLSCSLAFAQSVRWESAETGDPSDLQLVFEDCAPSGDPVLPTVDGLTFTYAGQSTNMSLINGSFSRMIVLTYRVRSRTGSRIDIPAFTVETNKGAVRVAAFSGGQAARSLESVASSTIAAPATTFWQGEVFPLTYKLTVPRRYFNQLGTNVEWQAAPLLSEDWSKAEAFEVTTNGEQRLEIVYHTRAYAKSAGRLALNTARQLVNLQTGSVGFGLFQQPRLEQVAVTSNQLELVIKPLPPGAPAGFKGAIGQFTLESKVVPASATVGEPITWTLTLTGAGNWPDVPGLPARDVSRDFQVVQPQAKRTPTEGKLFDVTLAEDVVLLPTRAGTYTLGPVAFTYFDPKSGTYKTARTETVTVTINAPEAPKFNLTPPAANPSAAANTPETSAAPPPKLRDPVIPPAAPTAIPREPIPGSGRAFAPLPRRAFVTALLLPVGAFLVFWLALALQRAWRTDPLRTRREAHARLAATLVALRSGSADTATRSRHLLAWQHDTAILWQLAHAAPPATALPDATWRTLWSESERALYSPTATLPPDWVSRAEAALTGKRLRRFSPFHLFLPRNLLPFAAALALSFVVISAASAEEPAIASYNQGDFKAAEKNWREALAGNPTDWIAHHNLALALAQQDRWEEAAAHSAAALVQQPRNASVRWHFDLACEKAGYVPAPVAHFKKAVLPIRPASPFEWQMLLVISVLFTAIAAALWLSRSYDFRPRWGHPLAITFVALAVAFAIAGGVGLRAYGVAADARAVIAWHGGTLRSIPTEADTTQKTSVLSPGSAAIVDKTFLGWLRLSFPNGQTGWVRQEEVVPLWR